MQFTDLWADYARLTAIALGFGCLAMAVSATIDPRDVPHRRATMTVLALFIAEAIVVSVEALGRPAGGGLAVRLIALVVGSVTLWRITWGAPSEGHRG